MSVKNTINKRDILLLRKLLFGLPTFGSYAERFSSHYIAFRIHIDRVFTSSRKHFFINRSSALRNSLLSTMPTSLNLSKFCSLLHNDRLHSSS